MADITANKQLNRIFALAIPRLSQQLRQHLSNGQQLRYKGYLTFVSVIGGGLVLYGFAQSYSYTPISSFVLFIALVCVATLATTSVPVSEQAGITYTIGEAVILAVIPLWGVGAACILATVSCITAWITKPTNVTTWKKSWSQLTFNIGMYNIAAMFAAGIFLVTRAWLGPETLLGQSLPWLLAAVIYSETNLWLLLLILRLQHGRDFDCWKAWSEERWATQIEVTVLTIGGGLLAYAATHYDQLGIVIFFVPVLLSAYAFRLYVRQMQNHLDNLEQIVAERTQALAESKAQVELHVTELAELNRQKDSFLTVLTHDMITPLSSMQMLAELLKKRPESVQENPRIADLMLRNQKTLFTIVHNVLDIEKLRVDEGLPRQNVTCSLNLLVTEVTEVVAAEARAKHIELTCQLDEGLPEISADRQQLERVLLNLISNAIKYTPKDGQVMVQTLVAASKIVIRVQDTGYGIPSAELPQIFERFYRVGQLRDKATGTGLGLAISKALVENHQGTITVDSTEGEGTIVTVQFPIQ